MRTEDEQAVRAAVADALSKEGSLRATSGELHVYRELWGSLDARIFRRVDSSWTITRLTVVSIDGDTAVVDVDAVQQAEFESRAGERIAHTYTILGPIQVVREPDGWKVTSYLPTTDLDPSFPTLLSWDDLSGSAPGIKILVLGGSRVINGRYGLALALEARNELPHSVHLLRVLVGERRGSDRWSWGPSLRALSELPPGITRFELQGASHDFNPDDAIRVLLRTTKGPIDVRQPGAQRLVRPPLALAKPHVPALLIGPLVAAILGSLTNVGDAMLLLTLWAVLSVRPVAKREGFALRRPSLRSVQWLLGASFALVVLAVTGGLHDLDHFGFGWPSWWWWPGIPMACWLLLVRVWPRVERLRKFWRLRDTIAELAAYGWVALILYFGSLSQFAGISQQAAVAQGRDYMQIVATTIGVLSPAEGKQLHHKFSTIDPRVEKGSCHRRPAWKLTWHGVAPVYVAHSFGPLYLNAAVGCS